MASPMYLEVQVDKPAMVHAAQELLEPKYVSASQSLQEFAVRNGLASGIQKSAPLSEFDASWSLPLPSSLPPVPKEDSVEAWDAQPVQKRTSPCLERFQKETGFSASGAVAMQHMSEIKFDCEPALKEMALVVARLSMKQSAKTNRWWTMPGFPMVCPFSAFPINMLPYPPFKLRHRAADSNPDSLIDGKYLALLIISTGSINVNGRCLELSELDALGKHIQRCKLGPHRPDVAFSLAEKACNAGLPESERAEAVQSLTKMQAAANRELGKLRWIQEQRLYQLHERLTLNSEAGAAKHFRNQEVTDTSPTRESLKTPKQETRKSFSMGSNSTCSFSSATSSSSDSEDTWEPFVDLYSPKQ
mmetsp:Transcript_142913/g.247694  ORF Transcript_142913/g.247694 Transcript_142913/m.247694 type:complete len:360 (-) Transcript_142913:643-1722(-)